MSISIYQRLSEYITIVCSLHSTMATNGSTNGETNGTLKFDPTFTKSVLDATGPKANPRLKKVVGSLVQHVHDLPAKMKSLSRNSLQLSSWYISLKLCDGERED